MANPVFYICECCSSDMSNLLIKQVFVECDDLRDINDRIFCETGFDGAEKDISWCGCDAEITGDDNGDHGSDPALKKRIGLYEQHRAPIPRRCTGRFR